MDPLQTYTQKVLVVPQFGSKKLEIPLDGAKITVGSLRRRIFDNYKELVENPENTSLLAADDTELPDDTLLDSYFVAPSQKTAETRGVFAEWWATWYEKPGGNVLRLRLKKQPTYLSYLSTRLNTIPYINYILPLISLALSVLFIAACAQLSFYLPWDTEKTVPITMQTFAVLFLGAATGPVWGFVNSAAYLLAGIAGAPFFASQRSGWSTFSGPTCGFLISFPIAAALVGYLSRYRGFDKRILTTVVAMVLGNLVIYAIGATWLGVRVGSANVALTRGVVPFLPGDLVKIVIAAVLLPLGWRFLYFRQKSSYGEVDIEA